MHTFMTAASHANGVRALSGWRCAPYRAAPTLNTTNLHRSEWRASDRGACWRDACHLSHLDDGANWGPQLPRKSIGIEHNRLYRCGSDWQISATTERG